MSAKGKPPISLRIRLKYPDEDTFVASYAPNISRGGIFIQSRAPQPEGTTLRFELVLKDNARLIRGEGYVVWVKEYDASQPAQPYGMGVRFTRLDEDSQRLVERVISFKEGSGLLPANPPKRSQTQEFRSIANQVELADAEEPQQPTEPAPAQETHAEPRPSAGNGVPEICRWADGQLQELIDAVPLSAEAVETALRSALETTQSVEDLEGLEELLNVTPGPVLDPAVAREELRRRLDARAATRAPAPEADPEPATEPVSPPSEPTATDPDLSALAPEPDEPRADLEPAVTGGDTFNDAEPNGNDAEPNGNDAEPNGNDAEPNGNDAEPNGNDAEPNGDSGFEEFSPIADAEDENGDMAYPTRENKALTFDDRDNTPSDTPRFDTGEPTEVSDEHDRQEVDGETLIRPLASHLEQNPLPDLEEHTSQGTIPDLERPTLPQERWHPADLAQPVDADATDVVDSWGAQHGQPPAQGHPDEMDRPTDPDDLEDATVDLGGLADYGATDQVNSLGPELLGDELANDPDLNDEVFEALAGAGELPAATPEDQPGMEEAPSLELLATRAKAGTPATGVEALPEDGAPNDGLNIVVDDDEDAAGQDKPAVQKHKSGLFRRLFGRKES